MEPTKRPWKAGEPFKDDIAWAEKIGVVALCYGADWDEKVANARHIVKCVNSHDKLVEALRGWQSVVNEKAQVYCNEGESEFVANLVRKTMQVLAEVEAT